MNIRSVLGAASAAVAYTVAMTATPPLFHDRPGNPLDR
jgi:hypothetical protein